MGMGFAPTWLRQVSPLLHKTTLTTASVEIILATALFDRTSRCDSAVTWPQYSPAQVGIWHGTSKVNITLTITWSEPCYRLSYRRHVACTDTVDRRHGDYAYSTTTSHIDFVISVVTRTDLWRVVCCTRCRQLWQTTLWHIGQRVWYHVFNSAIYLVTLQPSANFLAPHQVWHSCFGYIIIMPSSLIGGA